MDIKKSDLEWLNRINLIALVVHLISVGGQIYFATEKANWKYPVTIEEYNKLSEDDIKELECASKKNCDGGTWNSGDPIDEDALRTQWRKTTEKIKKERLLFEVPLGYSQALFSIVCVIAHATLYYLGTETNIYATWMHNKVNYMRWFEYFISSAIMMVNIAGLSGIRDIWSLVNIFVLTAITNIFGLMSEKTTGTLRWILFILGFLPFFIPWGQLYQRFYTFKDWFNGNYEKVQKRANPDDEETGKIPNFVQYILIGLLGIYCIFPLIQYLQLSNTINYIDGEKYYVIV